MTRQSSPTSASRTKLVQVYIHPPDGDKAYSVDTELTIRVSIGKGDLPVMVQGFGLNCCYFSGLDAVWRTFCLPFSSPIKLDNHGCELIKECLNELGFKRPSGYWN